MFDEFQRIYRALESKGVEKPLEETLKLYDILSLRSISRLDKKITKEMSVSIEHLANARKAGVPTEYIIGKAPFMGQLFACSSGALIPREETELLTRTSIKLIHTKWPGQDRISVIDMGTGCGNIAISIALHVKNALVVASDLNDDHVRIARENVQKFNLNSRITLYCGDLLAQWRIKDMTDAWI